MSAFILKTDYGTNIKSNILDDITESDDTKLDVAETRAIEEIKGYLNARYDVENIFNKTGNDRNPIILMHAVNMSLYYLHSLINHRKIPDFRKEAKDDAIEWLTLVMECKINPPGLPLIADGAKDYIKYGSNPRRNNQY